MRNFNGIEKLKLNFFFKCRVNIPPDEPTPEPEIEDDDAELILEKLEEEINADFEEEEEEEEEDIIHVDDITKLYGENLVRRIFSYWKINF